MDTLYPFLRWEQQGSESQARNLGCLKSSQATSPGQAWAVARAVGKVDGTHLCM